MVSTEHRHPQRPGILLVGHGTRNELGREEFLTTAADVAAGMPDAVVEPCFLELADPDIDAGVKRLTDQNVDGICVVPLMLLAAGHVKRDVPDAVREAAKRHAAPPWILTGHLGCGPNLLRLSQRRYEEAIANGPDPDPRKSLLLIVARGNRDPEAVAEMHRFVERRRERTPGSEVRTCFMAMAEPAFEQVLAEVDHETFGRVVIQPHLLYVGRMLSSLRQRVDVMAESYPDTQWLVSGHLGPSELLTRCIVDLIEQSDGAKRSAGGFVRE